jgi:hypothetical protein
MMNINTQQRARGVGHDNLCVPDSESVASAQIACGRQRSAIEPNRLSDGLDDPDAFTPLYCESDSRFYARDDDVGVRAADGCRFAKNPLTQGLANANLRISGGSHRGRIIRSQIGSEQLTLIVWLSCPGAMVISR